LLILQAVPGLFFWRPQVNPVNDAEIRSSIDLAARVAASLNADKHSREAMSAAIKSGNVNTAVEVLRKHGLAEAKAENVKFVKQSGTPEPQLVCLEWRYFLTPTWRGWGIDWDVNEWCAAWAHG
jgi:hypothetical protein